MKTNTTLSTAVGRNSHLVPLALYGMLLIFLGIHWLKHPFNIGVGDWDWVFSDAFQSANGFLERGWFPFWTIQTQGGAPLAGNPESLSQSPLILILIAAGSIVGIKLILLLLMGIGLVGCHVLGRYWFHDAWAATSFTLVFVLSGYFAIRLRVGHFMWAAFFLVPWILYFVDRILFETSLKQRDLWGLFTALLVLISGPLYHPLVFFLIPVLICYALTHAFKANAKRLCAVTAIFFLAAVASSTRIIAILQWELSNPRHTSWREIFSPLEIFKMLVLPLEDYSTLLHRSKDGAWEYWAFVGVFSLILAVIGAMAHKRWKWFAICLILTGVLLSASNENGDTFLGLFRGVPILSSVRAASRFVVLVVFGIALLVGGSVTVIKSRAVSHPSCRWVLLLFLFVTINYLSHILPIWTHFFLISPEQVYSIWNSDPYNPPYSYIAMAPEFQPFANGVNQFDSRMFPLIQAKTVVQNAYTGLNLPPFRPTSERVIDSAQHSLYTIDNHRIKFMGSFKSGEIIKINLLYHPYWKPEMPGMVFVENDHHLMRLAIQHNCSSIVIEMHPPWEKITWIISGLGILGMVATALFGLRHAQVGDILWRRVANRVRSIYR
jgi:hypothetical protein